MNANTRSRDAAIGGLHGALGDHADATLARMTVAQQRAARRMLVMLVTLDLAALENFSRVCRWDPVPPRRA
jgi:hypothetical protein